MNERIRELGDQAKPLDENGQKVRGLNSEYHDQWMEKFAELVIRECAKFLDENSGYDDANNAWHPEPEDLLKHFGLE